MFVGSEGAPAWTSALYVAERRTPATGVSLDWLQDIHVDASQPPCRVSFRFDWGGTEVFVVHATSWEIARRRQWRHATAWANPFAATQRGVYGLRLESTQRFSWGELRRHRGSFAGTYGDLTPHRVRAVFRYEEPERLAKRHRVVWADLTGHARSLRAPYLLTQQLAVRQGCGYALREANQHARQLRAAWSILADARLQAVANTPELLWQGSLLRLVQATLSCDEESPTWLARIELAELADFAAIAIGDAIEIVLGMERFVLVVDGKMLSRPSSAALKLELTALSPVALQDAPFASPIQYYVADPQSARAAVETVIGPVDWQLPDWIIPAGSLLIDSATPLAVARRIVEAIGGIVESHPEGTLTCRRRHPVSIPDYGTTDVAQTLYDADVLSVGTSMAPLQGYNRVTLSNEAVAASTDADRIEFVVDESSPYQGTVRAYLGAERPVTLVHTGHPETTLTALGVQTRLETEVVEFIEGVASTHYPVQSITQLAWQHGVLGDVQAVGQTLTAAIAGYSLLRLTYSTASHDWQVTLPVDEEVQFVLVDS